jgi:hypothetical protein
MEAEMIRIVRFFVVLIFFEREINPKLNSHICRQKNTSAHCKILKFMIKYYSLFLSLESNLIYTGRKETVTEDKEKRNKNRRKKET